MGMKCTKILAALLVGLLAAIIWLGVKSNHNDEQNDYVVETPSIADFYHWRAFAELSPYVLICDGDDNFLRIYIQTSRNCKFKIEYFNKYFSNLVNVTSIFTSKLYRLRLWYLGCRFNFTLISGKKY